MGIFSEIQTDGDACKHCGVPLYRHISRRKRRQVHSIRDDGLWVDTYIDVTCGRCGQITTIFWEAEPIECAMVERVDKPLFRCAPTVKAIHAKDGNVVAKATA